MSYSYRVVTGNGAGVHAGFVSFKEAQREAVKMAAAWTLPATFEIERVEHTERGSRYWMRRGSRWVHWNALEGPDVRKPDYSWTVSR